MKTSDGWAPSPPGESSAGPRWVIVASPDDLPAAARRHGLGEQAIALLQHRGPGAHPSGPDHPLRARLDRSSDGEFVLTAPTLSFVEATNDVHTGALICVVGADVVVMSEVGDADVTGRAVEKLTGGFPVPDEGVHQVLAAVVLTMVAEASAVEIALGDAVADLEHVVFTSTRHTDTVERIYDLKREIAEARRALGPVTSMLPELIAEAEESSENRRSRPWLIRAVSWVDRLDNHLDGYDDLLGDMLSVHLSQVSVRQNEDVRKISSWAAIAAAPTLVASIYGMNFENMPELSWTLGYPLSIATMAAVCVSLYALFRRSGWL
ncbi:magnesium and cobalt transport protein CorA [Cellulomonas sp. zg-ZUI188]|uniref:Magnesium and cobalt transport protein CorA n=1 Tax=Cellulomonas fengjieae TaxID=2819978 RepID=A0ABS3SLK6_9CELL|nr:magnesium and cobalt transport protein CorA [Cellulomonas fengjieae]MBO3102961.1 magnesium and cobalt transport protein CorA [Cellulomonas fengjieae]QVI67847.1 magnesium and cobalt transport protein CorA [Cellulomonas fengjieae]